MIENKFEYTLRADAGVLSALNLFSLISKSLQTLQRFAGRGEGAYLCLKRGGRMDHPKLRTNAKDD